MGYSPRGRQESDMTERLNNNLVTQRQLEGGPSPDVSVVQPVKGRGLRGTRWDQDTQAGPRGP